MIKIAKLHLRNFKSFRKAEIPFADGFTAIVGANASGKSNILDSILFSLGITSLKMLRASKLTELVNSGADEPFARVTIELKDTEKKVNYEITRIIDTQGKGDFRLDGKHVGLNEITTFLLELGIRPDGHNLVVQGDITRVIEMSAKQRREIIDNVAGLAEFDEKKEESLKELERVEQRIRETMIVLRERKAFVDQLSKEKESAEKFVKLQAEMNSCRYTLLQEELKRIRAEIRSAQKGEKEFGEEKAKLAERKSKEKEKREGLAKKLGEIDAKIIAANSIATEGIMKRLEEKRFALGIALERQSAKKEAMQRLGQRLSSLKQRQASLGEEEKSRLAEKSGLEKELELLSRQIGEEEKGIAEARNKFEAERKKSVEAEDRRAKAAEKLDAERKKYYALKEKEAGALAEISATRKMLEEFASDSKRKEIVDAISELAALLKEAGALCAKAGKAAEKAEEKQKKSLLEFAEFGKRLEKRIEAVKSALEGAVNAKAVNEKLKRVSELEKALGQNAKEKALLEKSVLQLEKELGEAAEGTRSGKALEIRTQLPKGLVEKRTNLLTNIAIIGSRLSSSIRDERKAIGIEIAEIEAETEKHQKDSAESETPPIEEQRRGLEKLEAEYEKTKRENESVLKQKREVQETLAECEREREGTEKQLG
ncbi:MAG: AAA family ATPase, partial [archaeon]